MIENDKFRAGNIRIFDNLEKDLMYLQEEYKIVKK